MSTRRPAPRPPAKPGGKVPVPLLLSLAGLVAGTWLWSRSRQPDVDARTAARLRPRGKGGSRP